MAEGVFRFQQKKSKYFSISLIIEGGEVCIYGKRQKMDLEKNEIIVRYLNGACSEGDVVQVEKMLKEGIEAGQWTSLLEAQKMPDIVPAEEKMESMILERIQIEINEADEKRVRKRRVATAIAASVLLMTGLFGYQYLDSSSKIVAPQKLVNASSSTLPTFLVMEDQSEIWINSKSSVDYPSRFSDNKREVTLKGQAFFKITKEKKRQFVVHAGELDIKVLGTTFDVKSYPEENETVITLLTGKIEVELAGEIRHTLLPNQQLIFDKTAKMLTLHDIRADHYDSWRYGEIIFTNLPLEMIGKGLERKFNKTFVIDKELKSKLITLKLKRGGLREALEILSHSANLNYSIRGETVIIKKKPGE